MTNIEELADVIHKLHGVDATYVESVPVREVYKTNYFGMGSSRFSARPRPPF